MKWEKTTIGEHCTVTSSKRFHLSERSNSGVPFYCSKEIIQKVNGHEVIECDYIREELYEQVKKQFGVPETGDLLITTRGTYGVPYIYSTTDRFYFADGNLTWLKDFDEKLLPEFLFYWVKSYEGQGKIDAIAKGTAQKAVPIVSIKALEIPLPSITQQKRIIGILSAYDNLIENNQKQIKLLEEAAQRLYKEWFVDLRFPGYEATLVVDGVPKGWAYKPFSDVFSYVRGKSYTSKELSDTTGVLMINLKNIRSFGGYNRNAEKRFTGRYNANQILSAGDVIMGVTDMTQERRLVGHAALVPDMGETMTFSMDLIKLVVEAHLEALFEPPSLPRGVRGINIKLVQDTAIKRYSQLLKDENQPYQLYDNHLIPLVSDTELKEIEMAVSTCHSSVNKRVSRFWKRYQIIYS